MNLEADTAAEYEAALASLERFPLIGTHTIGELTISASMNGWSVKDDHDNTWGAKARSSVAIRKGIHGAVKAWMRGKFQTA